MGLFEDFMETARCYKLIQGMISTASQCLCIWGYSPVK